MRKHQIISVISVISLIVLSSCGVVLKEKAKLPSEVKMEIRQLLDSISDEKLLNYVKKLSSEDYGGRLTGTWDYKACARWLATHFKKWGLKPMGENNGYLQSYPNPFTIVFEGGELSYSNKSKGRWRKKVYIYEKEYYPGSQSGNGKLTAEVVYAGYGITAPELNYDDYAGVNVRGKIVLVEPEVPVSPNETPQLAKEWRPYSFYQYKVKMAVAHGAKGMLIHSLAVNPNIDYVKGLKVAQVGDTVIQDVFSGTGKIHRNLKEKIKSTLKPQSFRTQKIFTINNVTEHHPKGIGYNVIGMIEGEDPLLKDEVIILGANLDHVGFCYEVIPGANDNASGVAVMMGVAEAIAKSPIKPKRSVLFIGFGSKEQAFKGSLAYLNRPLFPKNKTVAFLNLDMVGCGDKLKVLSAQNHPEIWKYISKANRKSAQQRIEPLVFTNLGRPLRDSDIFAERGVPSISFKAYGAPTFPHTTKDTVETITPEIIGNLVKILYWTILDISNTNQDFFSLKLGMKDATLELFLSLEENQG